MSMFCARCIGPVCYCSTAPQTSVNQYHTCYDRYIHLEKRISDLVNRINELECFQKGDPFETGKIINRLHEIEEKLNYIEGYYSMYTVSISKRIEKLEKKPEAKKAKCDDCKIGVYSRLGNYQPYFVYEKDNDNLSQEDFQFCPNCGNKNDT